MKVVISGLLAGFLLLLYAEAGYRADSLNPSYPLAYIACSFILLFSVSFLVFRLSLKGWTRVLIATVATAGGVYAFYKCFHIVVVIWGSV